MEHEHRFVKEATYYYTTRGGAILFRKVKKRCACGQKTFMNQRRLSGTTYVNGLGSTPKVLYNLATVADAIEEGHPIWIVDGEKDVETLRALGEVATCPPDGSGSWTEDYATSLVGSVEVRTVADMDTPGIRFTSAVRTSLVGRVQRILRLAPVDGCKDVTEHIDAGYGLTELRGDSLAESKGIAAGLAQEFSRAMLRPDDARLPEPEAFEIPDSWPVMTPEPTSLPAQLIRDARTAREGTSVPPHAVPYRCEGCGGFLMVETKPGHGRTCHRCRVTYVSFEREVDRP